MRGDKIAILKRTITPALRRQMDQCYDKAFSEILRSAMLLLDSVRESDGDRDSIKRMHKDARDLADSTASAALANFLDFAANGCRNNYNHEDVVMTALEGWLSERGYRVEKHENEG